MSRKNLLTGISVARPASTDTPTPTGGKRPPPLGLAGMGALGAVTRTIDSLAARASAAKSLEEQLASGATVVDLDPELVDRSFMHDRMEGGDDSYMSLLEAIRAQGQDSPILVRPHPEIPGRYQTAFGHRRLRAAAELGRPVRAVVRNLSDLELVLAQGQENSARADLSFIERACFAKRIEDMGYGRDTIMKALGIDKSALSRLVSVATDVPAELIVAIGPAPGIGRDRWLELVQALSRGANGVEKLAPLLRSADFSSLPSAQRFEAAFAALSVHPPAPAAPMPPRNSKPAEQARYFAARNGKRVAKITTTDKALTLTVDSRVAPGFGDFLVGELERLYSEYTFGR